MTSIRWLVALTLCAVLNSLACSSDKNSTNPEPAVITFQGGIYLPGGSALANSDLTVGFGLHDATVTDDGAYAIQGNEHVPGVLMATVPSGAPVLMAVVPSPTSDQFVPVDVHTTAVSLVFLHPFICTNNPEYIDGVLADIETLPQLAALENALESTLSGESLTLDTDDDNLSNALESAVEAYVNGFSATSKPRPNGVQHASTAVEGIEIEPDYQVSGLQLRWKGGSEFELTNSLGRWAYCTTPEDTFFVFPNGDFLDILKGSRPWSPTTQTFHMSVPPNADAQEVHVYGYGFASTLGNEWDSLEHAEQQFAHAGGIPTVLIELCAPMISVVTNTSVTLGREEIAKRIGGTVIGLMLSQGTLMQQLGLYAQNDDPWGLSWTLSKWVMNELVTNTQFRAAFISATGMALTSASLTKLAAWLSVPAKVVMTFNSVSSVLKTTMGFTAAEFNTAFEVWQDVIETGAVRGQVADSIDGLPISGAVVQLSGDEDNPLNPTHQVTTAADGWYYFSNIITGPKSISASKSGYATKTISVIIEKDKEITAHIPLAHLSGGLSGRILDGILAYNSVAPATIEKPVQLEAHPVSGSGPISFNIQHGSYSVSLSPGTWWVKAVHEDYLADSFQVTVPSSGAVTAPRDLVLQPHSTMQGIVYLDMNNDGSYDQTINVSFPAVGLAQFGTWACDGSSQQYAFGVGVRGSSQSDYDATYIGFRATSISEAAEVSVGPIHEWPCDAQSRDAIVFFSTTRQHCYAPDVTAPMTFTLDGNPDKPGCGCGISNPGSIYLTDWGTNLGDLVAGGMTIELPGWAGCYCDAYDTDQDGTNDLYDVACARAHIEIDFRLLVGSDYVVPWMPSSPPYDPLGRP